MYTCGRIYSLLTWSCVCVDIAVVKYPSLVDAQMRAGDVGLRATLYRAGFREAVARGPL